VRRLGVTKTVFELVPEAVVAIAVTEAELVAYVPQERPLIRASPERRLAARIRNRRRKKWRAWRVGGLHVTHEIREAQGAELRAANR